LRDLPASDSAASLTSSAHASTLMAAQARRPGASWTSSVRRRCGSHSPVSGRHLVAR